MSGAVLEKNNMISPHKRNTAVVLSVVILASVAALHAQTGDSGEPVARIAGETIYESDLLPSVGLQLLQLQNQEYDLKMKALRILAGQRLLEKAATAKGLSKEAFLQETVDKAVPAPSPGEVEAYYLAQKDRLNQPFSQVKLQVEQALIEAKKQQARQDYMDRLYQSEDVAILLNRPRADVSPDPARLRGDASAPVTIVEFADFQCPYCQRAQDALHAVLEKYQGKVRISFRDFPLRSIHPDAERAAEASRCAGEQGKYWEYYDLLFTNQIRLEPNGLREYASQAGLDVEKFGACLASGKFAGSIESDVQAGMRAGVTSTPTFFVNGIAVVGLQPPSAFESIIESELARREARASAKLSRAIEP